MWPAARTSKHLLLVRRSFSFPKTLNPFFPSPPTPFSSDSDALSDLRVRILLLTDKKPSAREILLPQISALADALLSSASDDPDSDSDFDSSSPAAVLAAHSAASLLHRYPSAPFDLLCHLRSRPLLALEVFHWRLDHVPGASILPEEYSKAISLAGHAHNPDLAADLFANAKSVCLRDARLYNALMAAYMYNGLTNKCVAAFQDLKRDAACAPTIVTYNILLSASGGSMLVDKMDSVLGAAIRSGLPLNLNTYNTLISAYLTFWKWDRMEATFRLMVASPVRPDTLTHLLMLRGYAHGGSLEKMEKTYEIVRQRVNDQEVPLIRAMICAYCKSSDPDRVRKVEALTTYIPEHEYRPWLKVLLIRLYAQEGMVETMERFISDMFHDNTAVTTLGVMRSIISTYFRCNAVDKLARFVRQAEEAGWRLGRSLYHCKMVMYGQRNRLEEMHGVLDEMEACKLNRTKKTFIIMYKAYSNLGRKYEVEAIHGMLWKHGLSTPEDGFLS